MALAQPPRPRRTAGPLEASASGYNFLALALRRHLNLSLVPQAQRPTSNVEICLNMFKRHDKTATSDPSNISAMSRILYKCLNGLMFKPVWNDPGNSQETTAPVPDTSPTVRPQRPVPRSSRCPAASCPRPSPASN
jgi:hypothetical protein